MNINIDAASIQNIHKPYQTVQQSGAIDLISPKFLK